MTINDLRFLKTVVKWTVLGQSGRILSEVEEKINGILEGQMREQTTKLETIRKMIHHVKVVDATTCLELALLKRNMDRKRSAQRGTTDCLALNNSRITSVAEIIIPNVLLFVDDSY